MHQSCLKNHRCVLGWISRSHARVGSEIQTSGRHASAGKMDKFGFLIPVIPKHGWKSWNLAWSHDMAPTCCGNFFWPNWDKLWYKLLANRSFSQEGSWWWEGTCHVLVRNDIRTLLSPTLIFLQRHIRQNRSIMLNFGIIPSSSGLFYTLIDILGI